MFFDCCLLEKYFINDDNNDFDSKITLSKKMN